jgi:hypothetical protein
MYMAYPFRLDERRRIAIVDSDEHINQLLEQLLFTMPGERVNRPSFGSGLMQLLFAPSSDELATTTQFLIQGALQQWLGDLVQIEAVEVESQEETLRVTVQYVVRQTEQRHIAQFER